jgi:putative protease
VTSVYRKALDAAIDARAHDVTANDWYRLEMTFSRGLFSGWMHGVNHQRLVPARFGKKRGPFAGRVTRVGPTWVEADGKLPLSVGDGVVFDTGGDPDRESGGRIVRVTGRRIEFDPGRTDLAGVSVGDRVWKTDDPALGRELRASFAGHLPSRSKPTLDVRVSGRVGEPLRIAAGEVSVESSRPLEAARNQPLTTERLVAQLGKLDETPFALGEIANEIEGEVIVPISEVNRLRRELVYRLTEREPRARVEFAPKFDSGGEDAGVKLSVLCRTMEQLEAAFDADVLLVDFEDIRRYREAVAFGRRSGSAAPIFLATPRIQKAGEQGFFKLIENAEPDGVLIRNVGAIEYFRGSSLRRIGDFSLNVANPLTARVFKDHGLERLTISYDLTIGQVLALLAGAPPGWFELTIHQHMPMFHMEHCVFAAFLSDGTDHTNCGRPCDVHRVHLRDRVGVEHPLRADVGCRNTLFNAKAQTGAKFFDQLTAAGLRSFRVELLEESADETRTIIETYRALLDGRTTGENLWRHLRAQPQLGVTQGTY